MGKPPQSAPSESVCLCLRHEKLPRLNCICCIFYETENSATYLCVEVLSFRKLFKNNLEKEIWRKENRQMFFFSHNRDVNIGSLSDVENVEKSERFFSIEMFTDARHYDTRHARSTSLEHIASNRVAHIINPHVHPHRERRLAYRSPCVAEIW